MNDPLNRMFGLHGKVALVTGGGTGIGLATAKCMAEAGAQVILAGRRLDVLKAGAAEIGPNASVCQLDLSAPETIAGTVAELLDFHGGIDILVNNAGNTVKKAFEDSTLADLDAVLDVHLRGALELSRHVIAAQLKSGGGNIIFLASMTSFIGQPLVLSYTAAKSALLGVVRGLSAEFAARGIRINGVAPGWIDTELYRCATSNDPVRRAKIAGRIQSGAVGKPEDIGWACVYLASPAAGYVTGQTLVVDGGALVGF